MWKEPGDFGATWELGGKQEKMEGGGMSLGDAVLPGTRWAREGRGEFHLQWLRRA